VRLLSLTLFGALLFVVSCAWRAPEVFDELRALRRRAAA
jgi:hypothetical protein